MPAGHDEPKTEWLTFAGGHYAPIRRCSSLIVRANEVEHRVRIGVGKNCSHTGNLRRFGRE